MFCRHVFGNISHGFRGFSRFLGGISRDFAEIEDVSINNEYEYENDFKPYSYSKSFSQLSMLAMTPSSSL